MIFMMLPDWLTGVRIETSPVSQALEGTVVRGVLWQAATGRYLLDVPETARYLVEGGTRLRIDRSPSASEADVLRFLRMTPLAALLFQRGILAFHAAAVVGSRGAVLIAGNSGVGKSTLVASLVNRGWNLLADDLTPVDVNGSGIPLAFPTFPEIILWPDAMEKLNIENPPRERHALSMANRFVDSPQPLRAIFWLTTHLDKRVKMSDINGIKLIKVLASLLYNSRIADILLDRGAYMHKATAIAGHIPVFSLERPRDHWCMDELADRVEEKCR